MEILVISLVIAVVAFTFNAAKKVSEIASSNYKCNKEKVEI